MKQPPSNALEIPLIEAQPLQMQSESIVMHDLQIALLRFASEFGVPPGKYSLEFEFENISTPIKIKLP